MKISIVKPIALSLLASAVITACGDNGDEVKKEKKVCIYNIQGGNSVDIKFGTAYTKPAVKVTQDGKVVPYKIVGDVDTSKLGKNEITYSSESCSNNQKRTVNVVPSSCAYKLIGSSPLEILLNSTYKDQGVEVKDINNKKVEYKTTNPVDTSKENEYIISYQGVGCENSQKRVVKVKAETAECQYELNGSDPLVIALNGEFTDPEVSVLDAKGNKVEKITISGDVVDTKIAKDYMVSYQGEGCSNDIERKVTVKKPVKCVFELQGDNPFNLVVGSDYTEPGFKIIGSDSKAIISGASEVNIDKNKIGQYEVIYQDGGCSNTATRTVEVVAGNCSYSFAENTNPLTLIKGADYIDIMPTVKNVTGEDIAENEVKVKSNNVDTTLTGDYEVVYEATDCPNTVTRQVLVELPNCTYKFPDDKSTMDFLAGQNYSNPKITIEGMADTNVVVLDGKVQGDEIGTYTLIYGAKDVCANTTNFIVNVKKVTEEDLKVMKDEIGKTILPKI